MAKKRRGHYCIVCASVLPNEKFSGKGHKNHICKKCSRKPSEQRQEQIKIHEIYNMTRFMNLSKSNQKKLQQYLNDESEEVRDVAQSVFVEYKEMGKIIQKDIKEEERITGPAEQEYLQNLNKESSQNMNDHSLDEDLELPF